MMVTLWPRAANALAAASPDTPAPITQTCFWLTMCFPPSDICKAAGIDRPPPRMPARKLFPRSCLVVGFGRKEIHFVVGRDAHDFGGIGEVVQPVEKRFKLLHRRNPEERARRLVGLVEVAMRNAAWHAHK